MKNYQELLEGYRKRRHDTVVDALATGLTYMDNVAVESGLLEEAGLLTELSESVCGALPFVIIAAEEGTRIVLGRKPARTGASDGAFRMLKTGAALGVGSAVAAASGLWMAIPATMGVRALFDRYRSAALTGLRVQGRVDRLHTLNEHIRAGLPEEKEEQVFIPQAGIPAEGSVT